MSIQDVNGVETWRCSNCDRVNDDYADHCEGCGIRFDADEALP